MTQRRGPRGDDPGPLPSEAPPGGEALFDARGAALLGEIEAALGAGEDAARLGARLRAEGTAPDEAAALLGQAGLRAKARAKFGEAAARMLFTPAGLEQASRSAVAALHAARFAAAGCRSVADLGCGIGTESLALLAAGVDPLPVEIDPFTARIAEHNLRAASGAGRAAPAVRIGDAAAFDLSAAGADGAFLDPARRTAGHRDTRRLANPDDYSPSLGFAFGLAARMPTGIKLGPGFDRELIPDEAEAQWVSVDGQLVETGLWFGAAARPGVKRSALVLRGAPESGDGASAAGAPGGAGVETHELGAASDAEDAPVRELGEYLYEPDGAVIRARLIGLLAERLGAGMTSEGIAYLTGDSLTPTPFAQAFRVRELLPAGEKQLRRALAERGIGRLEIKKRGADVDPAALRGRLKLKGSGSATLILTRLGGRHAAILADRA